ncbi:MAG: hypothetical protein GXO10_00655 [Crenarchaeota archaeon]|nr:hypothetical protein [Thermoproteota archaeon]
MARYIIVEVHPEEAIDKVANELVRLFEKIVGIGLFKGRLLIADKIGNRLIIRVPTRYLKYARYAILALRKIENTPVTVLTVSVTGTIRKARAQARSIPSLFDQELS